MALPQAIDIRRSMLRLAPQCFAFTSNSIIKLQYYYIYRSSQNFRDRKILRIASKGGGGAEIFATKIFAKAALIHCVIGASLSEPHMYE